ncbi:MAG TPA: DegQ family serine endoprotease [Chthoniobacter sp.]|jgi:serine protease Do
MKAQSPASSPRASALVSLLAVIGVVLIVLGFTSWYLKWPVSLVTVGSSPLSVTVNEAPLSRDTKLSSSFAPVVKRVAAGVVNVYSTKTVKSPSGQDGRSLLQNPFFRQFFGDQFEGSAPARPRPQKQFSLGSGVIVSADGHILTNNHVVAGADEIKVGLLKDDREFTAKLIGTDAQTDIAVLKIDAKDLSAITFADSDKIEVGDVVLAIGNPFGVGQTVTMGIISATRRGGMGIEDYEDFIQTDAAINPGNSGGALVDTEGRLVGLNTAILSRSGGNQGVGFAVPVNLARNIMEQIVNTGHVVRGYLGVSIQNLTGDLRKEFNAPGKGGVLVGGVADQSPAAAAGLKSGDVITELSGKPVEDSRTLRLTVAQTAPGSKVSMKIIRDGKEQTVEVTLQEAPKKALAAAPAQPGSNSQEETAGRLFPGVVIVTLDDSLRQRVGAPASVSGVVVAELNTDSNAAAAGLLQGDVIQEINHKPITSAEEAVAAVKEATSKHFLLQVWQHGGSRYLVLDESGGG